MRNGKVKEICSREDYDTDIARPENETMHKENDKRI